MATLFTADTHFGDAGILRARTGFPSVEAHDEALIAAWNAAVGEDDEVWHLGDFAHGASRERCREIFDRLRGRKRLVRGNHDSKRVLSLPWAEPPVETARVNVADAAGRLRRLFLAHYPHRAWPGLWRETRHLYGHTHATIPDTRWSCDVGVDAFALAPVTLEAILARQAAATLLPDELARRSATSRP